MFNDFTGPVLALSGKLYREVSSAGWWQTLKFMNEMASRCLSVISITFHHSMLHEAEQAGLVQILIQAYLGLAPAL